MYMYIAQKAIDMYTHFAQSSSVITYRICFHPTNPYFEPKQLKFLHIKEAILTPNALVSDFHVR